MECLTASDSQKLSMHSPWCGGTTEDVRGGVPDHVIDLQSRWKSAPTKYHYLKLTYQEFFTSWRALRNIKCCGIFIFSVVPSLADLVFLLQIWFLYCIFGLVYFCFPLHTYPFWESGLLYFVLSAHVAVYFSLCLVFSIYRVS